MKKIIIKKKRLKSLYCDQLLSSRMVAKIYDCDQGVILRNLRKYNLPVRSPKKKIDIPKERLLELYGKKGLSTYKIATIYNCDPKTVYRKLIEFKISTHPLKKVKIKKENLDNLYFNKNLSLAAIGKMYNCNPVTILKKMRKHGFHCRNSWETNEKHHKHNFSNNLEEKAYLLGFRAGDLYVKRRSKITGSIRVSCSSTKKPQIQLIKNLFKNYGPVWVGKPDGRNAQGVDTLLNSSFSFLIPKNDKINSWVLKSKKHFAAFLAGYTDAEGSVGIYDNRARFRLGSYDIGILKEITKSLKSQGIRAILKLERKKGVRNQRGDFWRITINERNPLASLFRLVGPYIKHSDRIKAINKAIDNIEKRNKRFNH